MFKNITIYSMSPLAAMPLLNFQMYKPAGKSQEESAGFVPPRGQENGELVESVNGQWIAKLMIETRSVPADAIARKVAEEIARIESDTGRKPGKKEVRELKEDARLALLPMAFSKFASVTIWFDRENNRLVLDTVSQSKADRAVTALIIAIPSLALQHLNTVASPASSMAQWLAHHEAPYGFSIDRECTLKACDESKAVVKYGCHPLGIEEIQQHIAQGKIPTCLALTWGDRVSLVLHETMKIKKIALDVVLDGSDGVDAFDADVAITTSELAEMIDGLIDAMGGLVAES